MNVGDRFELVLIEKGEEVLPSHNGSYIQRLFYDVYRDAALLTGQEFVLFQRQMFGEFVEEIRKARALNALLQPIQRPHMHFATGANDGEMESK